MESYAFSIKLRLKFMVLGYKSFDFGYNLVQEQNYA